MDSVYSIMDEPETLLGNIQLRPGLYLGEKSLSALHHFINGWSLALSSHGIKDRHHFPSIPPDFHDWVAYRTHFEASTTGWCAMIVSTTKNEEEAFDRFFELLEEHKSRIPTIMARLRQMDIALVTYTEDPGFFVVSDVEGHQYQRGYFYPSLDWFKTFVFRKINALEIIDKDRFKKLKRSRD